MKQTAVEWLIEMQNSQNGMLFECDIEKAKELEKEQQGYSEEEVELIIIEMVNWTLDNVGNSSVQSGKKFDEVISKFKNK